MDSVNTVTNDDLKCIKAFRGLYQVYDPEVGINVVDLGLIYELNFDSENKHLTCIFTLTTEFCPMGESITENITKSLENSFPDWEIDLSLIFDPPWEAAMISPEGQADLGW